MRWPARALGGATNGTSEVGHLGSHARLEAAGTKNNGCRTTLWQESYVVAC